MNAETIKQSNALTICFVGPNNLLIVKKNDSAVIVNKQPVKYIKKLAVSNVRPKGKLGDGSSSSQFFAKEFLLSPGEYSSTLLDYYCHKYWVILSGIGWITIDKTTHMVTEKQGILIPSMQEHRIFNSTTEPLKFVEICASERLSGNEQIQFIDNPMYL